VADPGCGVSAFDPERRPQQVCGARARPHEQLELTRLHDPLPVGRHQGARPGRHLDLDVHLLAGWHLHQALSSICAHVALVTRSLM
jgi:hypothetical protein